MHWDDESVVAPEEQLRRSARPLQRFSPWEKGVRVALEAPAVTWADRWARSGVVRWVHDLAVGLGERWYQRRHHTPSPRALDEALAYYGQAYKMYGPRPAEFARLLRRNGLPDWSNPFPEGSEPHYLYHPLGLMVADVEQILEGVQEAWEHEAQTEQDHRGEEAKARHPQAPSAWPTVADALAQQGQHQQARRERFRQAARECWAMAVKTGRPLGQSVHEVHPKNLSLATVQALLYMPLARDRQLWSYVKGAGQQGLLAPESLKAWLAELQQGRQRLHSVAGVLHESH